MIKTLMAAAVAAAFALPLMASAQSDTGASARQPGVNPPGAASPGSASTTVTGTDRDTGAAGASASGFDRLDKNRDGFISRDEARDASELNTRFSELDRNNGGKVSREEYSAVNVQGGASGGGTKVK